MTLAGIDVSAAGQGGSFDWQSWRGKVQFAAIKIGEGLTYADPDAARNIAGARSIGCTVIGYHFLHAKDGGAAQASYFMERCKSAGMGRGDLMALDAEQEGMDGLAPAVLWATAGSFASAVHGHFAAWPLCYTDIDLAKVASGVGDCPLWLANPSRVPTPGGIGPWKVVSFEQLGQAGVDTDTFYGDLSQLQALAVPTVAPAAPRPVTPAAPAKPTQAQAKAALDVLSRYVG